MIIKNIYRINENNSGDINSSPLKYFNFNCKVEIYDIENTDKNLLMKNSNNSILIIGGGGLLYDYWMPFIENLSYEFKGKKIIWGCGFNYQNCFDEPNIPYFFKNFDLIGIRQEIKNLEYVPCPSCMCDYFDKKHDIKKEYGIVYHYEYPFEISEIESISNSEKIENIINFIGEKEKIITNSYHGYYWSLLLNKPVIVIPVESSSRFYYNKYNPKIVKKINSLNLKEEICVYKDVINECRNINVNFFKKIKNLYE